MQRINISINLIIFVTITVFPVGLQEGSWKGSPEAPGNPLILIFTHIVHIVQINPLQYSCLENPMDRGSWWAVVHGVAKSRT